MTTHFQYSGKVPGLLVSVRNMAEASSALTGGADIIDVKEPNNGALGAADAGTIGEIVTAVAGRAPVTAAMGELCGVKLEKGSSHSGPVQAGVSLFKLGLAGCGQKAGWQSDWRKAINQVSDRSADTVARPVAVVYADWKNAAAPPPDEVLEAGVEFGCPALLIDTWNKSAGSLFDHWSSLELQGFLERVRHHQLLVVLAGSLAGDLIAQAARLKPDLVAVRGAACDDGRRGVVSTTRVRDLKTSLAQF